MRLPDLIVCATPGCGTRAPENTVASYWREGRCTLCQSSPEGREQILEAFRRGEKFIRLREQERC